MTPRHHPVNPAAPRARFRFRFRARRDGRWARLSALAAPFPAVERPSPGLALASHPGSEAEAGTSTDRETGPGGYFHEEGSGVSTRTPHPGSEAGAEAEAGGGAAHTLQSPLQGERQCRLP